MATTSSSKRQLIHTSNTYESNSDLTVGGDLFVNGATTTIDTANLLVEDKNIIIGNVSSPSDTTADGGGITLKGASDYTINWTNSTNSWHFNQGITVGVDGTGHDVVFYGDTSDRYMTWDQSADRLNLRDSVQLTLGTHNDLQLSHDGVHGHVLYGGPNNLQISGSSVILIGYNDGSTYGETAIRCVKDGAVSIRHNNSQKFTTDAGGITVTGKMTSDTITTALSLEMFASSGHNYISSQSSGSNLYIRNTGGGQILIRPKTGEEGIKLIPDGAVELYHDNGHRLSTTVDGISLHGNGYLDMPDNGRIRMGTNQDFAIYHNSSDNKSVIEEIGSGNLSIRGTNIELNNAANNKTYLLATDGGSVQLRHNDSTKLETSSTGATITGNLVMGSGQVKFANGGHVMLGDSNDLRLYHNGNSYIAHDTEGDFFIQQNLADRDLVLQCDDGAGGTTDYFRLDGGEAIMKAHRKLRFLDNVKATFGGSDDLQIFHDGSNSYIRDNGTGGLVLEGSTLLELKARSGEVYFRGTENGMAKLYYDNAGKLETTSSGVYVIGSLGVGVSAPAQKLHIEFADTDTSFSGGNGGAWGSEGLLIENTSSTTDTMAMIQLRTGDADLHIAGIRQGQNDNDLGFFFESQEKVRFTKDGNVGIGTTSPATKLVIDNGGVGTVDNGYSLAILGDGIDGVQIISSSSHQGRIVFGDNSSNAIGRLNYDHSNDSMSFVTNGSEAMRINSGGLVGIGVTNPEAQYFNNLVVGDNLSGDKGITVRSNSSAKGVLAFSDADSGTGRYAGRIAYDHSTNDMEFYTLAGNFAMMIDDAQQVGIGTTSPNYLLDVEKAGAAIRVYNLTNNGDTDLRMMTAGTTGNCRIFFGDTADSNVGSIIYRHNGNSLAFETNDAEAVRIDDSGNVGIGTTTPSRTLHVYDSAGPTIKFERGTASNLEFTFGSTNASIASAGEIQFRANGGTTNKFIINNSQIQSNAKFLVNTDSGIDVHTDDNGNILLSGNSSATGTPDQFFLKHNLGGVELGNNRGQTTVTTGNFQINTQFKLTSSGSGLTVIRHNGTNNYYENYNGHMFFVNHDADKHIYFQTDDGSGGVAEYFRMDGGSLRNIFSKGVDITGSLTTTATFGNRSTNQGINFETPTTALQTARVDSDAFRFYFGGTGGGQEVFRLEENGDLEVSGQIDSKNRKHKKYTSLTGSSGDWFPLFQVGDHHGGQVLFNINTYAHSSCTFIVSEGYGPSGQSANPAHISVLNYLYNANGGYANITGIRVKQDGFVEIRLTWGSGPTVDIDVTAETSELVQYGFVSSLATSTNSEAVVDTALLDNKRARFKNLEVDDRLFTSIGSATAPAICFTDDPDTGIYGATNNHLHITTGSAVRATFNSSGITSASNVYSGTNGQFRNYAGVWKATTGTTGNGFQFISADATAMVLSSTGSLDVTNNLTANSFIQDGNTGSHFYAVRFSRSNLSESNPDMYGEGDTLILGADSDQPTLVIRDTENVGIGTASPAEKLEVAGNIAVRNGTYPTQIELYESFTDGSNYERTQLKFANGYFTINPQETGTGTQSGIDLAIGGTSKLKIEPAGNVLINGAGHNSNKADFSVGVGGSPRVSWHGNQVQIGGTDMNYNGNISYNDSVFRMQTWQSNLSFELKGTSGTANKDIIFRPFNGTADTEAMRIKGDGKVGIGTSSPQKMFHVSTGDTGVAARFENTSSNGTVLELRTTGDNKYLYLQTDHIYTSSGALHIGNDSDNVYLRAGSVGIGTTNPSEKLHVVGSKVRLDTNAGGYYGHNASGTFRYALYDNNSVTRLYGDGDGSNAALEIDSNKVGLGCAATANSKASVFIKGEDNSPTLNGTAVDDATLILTNSYTTDPYGLCFGVNTSGTSLVQSRRLGSETYFKLALNPYGGNVGIGTDSPNQELEVDGVIKQKVYTVSTLPTAGSSTIGARAFVSDSYYAFSSSYLGSQISGGGSNFSPVYSDGSYWYMG